MEEGRLQRELLTENVKRANLSVLEELNLLASYYRNHHSLEVLAGDIGLTAKRAKERVMLAVLIQDKGLIESLYKIERISEFKFTHRHIEKLMALEEVKWLPLAIQAADHNWKAEEIERMGTKFGLDSLLSALPAWGWQFVPSPPKSREGSPRAPKAESETQERSVTSRNPKEGQEADKPAARRSENSPSRYQTVARFAQFLICPDCGSENVIELPLVPGRHHVQAREAREGERRRGPARKGAHLAQVCHAPWDMHQREVRGGARDYARPAERWHRAYQQEGVPLPGREEAGAPRQRAGVAHLGRHRRGLAQVRLQWRRRSGVLRLR